MNMASNEMVSPGPGAREISLLNSYRRGSMWGCIFTPSTGSAGRCNRSSRCWQAQTFYVGLALPDVSQSEVLEYHTEGNSTTVGLRYEFTGSLDPKARRLLGAKRPAWIQEVSVDASAAAGTITFEAERDPKRLYGPAGTIRSTTLV